MLDTNPVLVRLTRGGHLESLHRGAWVVARTDGSVVAAAGDPTQSVFARSSTKGLQALPLVESGAADAYGFGPRELAMSCASHSGEAEHLDLVASILAAVGLGEDALQCGAAAPMHAPPGSPLRRLAHNCSGKHAGFLALAAHIGDDPGRYLDPDGPTQRLVQGAVAEMCDADPFVAVDGCGAPTFALPLAGLATGIARLATPDALDPSRAEAARRLTDAVGAHPRMIGGRHLRIDSDLVEATGGRLFAKIGAEAVFVVGAADRGLGLALKIDDGAERGFWALLIELLARLGWIDTDERAALGSWDRRIVTNAAGTEVGEVLVDETLPSL